MAKTEFIYGLHAVKAMLSQHPEQIQQAFFIKSKKQGLSSLVNQALDMGISVNYLTRSALDKKVGEDSVHQGAVVQCNTLNTYAEKDIESLLKKADQPLVLVLDQVKDPRNLGACLRSANAMGVCCVIIPKDRSAGLTPIAQKVACGATVSTPLVVVTNLSRTLKKLQDYGLWLVGLSANTDVVLRSVDLMGPLAIVMGSEGEGLRQLTEKQCDFLACIPMQGTVESLNVSVATGVALYEVIRQRQLDS